MNLSHVYFSKHVDFEKNFDDEIETVIRLIECIKFDDFCIMGTFWLFLLFKFSQLKVNWTCLSIYDLIFM